MKNEELDLLFKEPGSFRSWLRITEGNEVNPSMFAIMRMGERKIATKSRFSNLSKESFEL